MIDPYQALRNRRAALEEELARSVAAATLTYAKIVDLENSCPEFFNGMSLEPPVIHVGPRIRPANVVAPSILHLLPGRPS